MEEPTVAVEIVRSDVQLLFSPFCEETIKQSVMRVTHNTINVIKMQVLTPDCTRSERCMMLQPHPLALEIA